MDSNPLPMLRLLTLPASWLTLLETLRPVFRRSSTFGLFMLLATGLVARTTRRTVVGMLAGAGVAALVSFHCACRFFSQYTWDTDRLGLAIARLIVGQLLPADAPIEAVVDDTLFRRWGKKVHHAFWTHDGAAQGPAKLGRGNRWVIVGIVAGCGVASPSLISRSKQDSAAAPAPDVPSTVRKRRRSMVVCDSSAILVKFLRCAQ